MSCNGDSLLGSAATLSFQDIQTLWINNGGPPGWAPLMAGIAMAESGGRIGILNDCGDTGDYSVGLWQINYYGNLLSGRTQSYGSPSALANDANAQAKAAISLFGGGAGIGNWKGDATYNAWQSAGAPQQPSAATVLTWLGGKGGSSSGGSLANATAGEGGGAAATAQIGCDSSGGVGIFGVHIGTQCQLKALAGGLMVGVGAAFVLMGAGILGATALRHTKTGQAVSQALPGPAGTAARLVTSRATRAGAPARTAATASSGGSRARPGPTGAATSVEASTRPVSRVRGITEAEAKRRERGSYALGHAAGHQEGHTEGILAERRATGKHPSGVSNAEVRRHRANVRGQSDGGFVRRGAGE